ncbi:MAG: serine/threonine-protein kinase [Planctomycetota bacterium]
MSDDRTSRPPGPETSPGPPALPSFPGLSRVEPLGSGGMGTVFRAWQDDLGRPVAVKTLRAEVAADPRSRELFAREAHILARLDHPGIVPVHYAGENADGPYYVMRLVAGESVTRHLAGQPAAAIAAVFRETAAALAMAHREEVLHRDVKPDNILVEPPGRPVLVDFGLSTRAGPGDAGADRAELVGTPDFLAPELLEGAGYSPASDIYALGATLYTVLTGRVPFPGADLGEKLRAIREEDPPLPRTLRPAVPKPLQAICLKAMERSPADRYASAAELARDLERFLAGDVVQAWPERSRSMLRRKLEGHIADLADWHEQGLLDDRQQAALQHACEHVEELGRGLLRGVLGSIPNLLLLVGIVLSVFGPAVLLLLTWEEQGEPIRLALPGVPFALLGGLGFWRWRARDRRRAVACLFGAVLLASPVAFTLADLVPALRWVVDDTGVRRPILPGVAWLAAPDRPAWVLAGARLLQWKLLLTSAGALAAAFAAFRGTRAPAFLWLVCLAGAGVVSYAAQLAGWRNLPPGGRWVLANLGSLAVVGGGLALDRRFQRDRALPFYGLGVVALLATALTYIGEGLPFSALGADPDGAAESWSALFHGLLFVAAGLAASARGTPLLRQAAGVPLFAGIVLLLSALGSLSAQGGTSHELLLILGCIAFLVLGLAVHRNSLVLPAAIVLPIAVGTVSQHHVQGLWAWSGAVVIGGAILVLLGFRLRGGGEAGAERSVPDRGEGHCGGKRRSAPCGRRDPK